LFAKAFVLASVRPDIGTIERPTQRGRNRSTSYRGDAKQRSNFEVCASRIPG
jgi:hypothetical protein